MPEIWTAGPGQEEALAATLALAFAADPVMQWIWPGPLLRLEAFREMARPYARLAVANGTAQVIGDFSAVALWLPPGQDIEAGVFVDLLQRTLAPAQLPAYLAQGARVSALHPEEPHWYLPLVGVDPAHFGKGLGSAMMAGGLEMADRSGQPVFLESTNPANLTLYRRWGFHVLEAVPGGEGPPKFALLREGRG